MRSEESRIARRMEQIQPFHAMEISARARELEAGGASVVHMEIGEPDFPTPQPIIDAAIKAAKDGDIHYTAAPGLAELREAISGYYLDRYRADVPARRILVTPGSSGALLLALGMLVNPGSEVLVTDPGYPCNKNLILFSGGKPRGIPVTCDSGYEFSADDLGAHWQPGTVAAILASPSNPTGAVITGDALKAIAGRIANLGGYLIMDEIYQGLTYGAEEVTALGLSEDIFVVNSFSKFWGMTGWRLGWLVVPEAFVRVAEKLAQNLFICASSLAQRAALAAFSASTLAILEDRRVQFRNRRDFLFPALRDLGFGIPLCPDGAFYCYADCSRFTNDSYQFCLNLLDKARVAITPGIDFGSFSPERHVRFSYTTSADKLKVGVDRMREFLIS